MMKTFQPNQNNMEKKWYLIDAKGKILGKVATEAAKILIGKQKAEFTPHIDCGDGVIVVNAGEIVVTGKKMKQKKYKSYSGYPGGLKEKTLEEMMKIHPTQAVEHAIKGMLPKNKLGSKMLKKLRVYADDKHFQNAQQPQEYKLN